MTTNPADLVKPPVVVPRDDSHDKFVTTLKQAGYGVIHTALTRTVTLPDAEGLTTPDLWHADWLVVTSKTTVGLLPTPLPNPNIKVAAVGVATSAALRTRGRRLRPRRSQRRWSGRRVARRNRQHPPTNVPVGRRHRTAGTNEDRLHGEPIGGLHHRCRRETT